MDWLVALSAEFALRGRELCIHYPQSLGRWKLKVPHAPETRNINTVTKLLELARKHA